jgi:hypothetical protein
MFHNDLLESVKATGVQIACTDLVSPRIRVNTCLTEKDLGPFQYFQANR